jgi:hypothetical protein
LAFSYTITNNGRKKIIVLYLCQFFQLAMNETREQKKETKHKT